jgi:hypothetical protein
MDGSPYSSITSRFPVLTIVVVALLLPSTGCVHQILATGIYFFQGGNTMPAECHALQEKRVVVVCRPPSSHEYRHAGASREIAKQVSRNLSQNVKKIDVVDPREVDNWIDESDWDEWKDLAKAVKADMVLYIELESFELFKGKTLYQGNSDITISVYDMTDGTDLVWDKHLGEVLYPQNSGIPVQDKPLQHFRREFVENVSRQISFHFYAHDPHAMFALDALANR